MDKCLCRRILAVIFLALFSIAFSSCVGPRPAPKKLDLSGVSLTVWDALQPRFPGCPEYSEEVSRVIEEFCRETGVKVEFRYAERREALEVLSGKEVSSRPHLMFSTEWPVASECLSDLSGDLDVTDYVDPAGLYWTAGDQFLGIPAYVQWIGTVVRAPGDSTGGAGSAATSAATGAATVSVARRTGYWVDSPAFFRAVLDGPGVGWNAESLTRYAKWVKETYGAYCVDPLASWQNGEVDALYPVTPYLYKWLRTSSLGVTVSVVPSASPFEDDSFYYTVPAYLVLTEDDLERASAVELGKRLAANLGRWAARALGCVPALVKDMPIFNLESGFDYEARQLIWQPVAIGTRAAPRAAEFFQTTAMDSVLAAPLTQYVLGEATDQSLEESIRGACVRHTKP